MPFLPEPLDEVAVSWKNRPFSEKHPIAGGSLLDCEGMELNGLRHAPLIEPQVVDHFHLSSSGPSATPSLPAKAHRFQSNFTEMCYRTAALSVRALHASAIPMACQTELGVDMTARRKTVTGKRFALSRTTFSAFTESQPTAAAAPRRSCVQAASRPAAAFRIPKVSESQSAPQAFEGEDPWVRSQSPRSGSTPAPPPPPPAAASARKEKRTA